MAKLIIKKKGKVAVAVDSPKPARRLFSEGDEPKQSTGGSWMTRGYEGVKREVAQQALRTKFTPEFYIKEEDGEVPFRILTDPINIYVHEVKSRDRKWPDKYTCLEGTGEECPFCEAGAKTYPRRYNAVYAVIDRRSNEWRSKKDGKVHKEKDQVKLWRCSGKLAAIVEKRNAKVGDIKKYECSLTRTGSDTSTTYMVDVDDRKALSPEDIKKRDGFDYISIIRPKKRSEILALIGGAPAGEDDEDPIEP